MRLARMMILAAAVFAAPAFAQDSTSTNADGGNGLPGDALSPWDASQQCGDYIVDTVPLYGSWGSAFRICPLVKSSKVSASYFNNLVSAQGISRIQALHVAAPATTYSLWENTPGAGINANQNTAGTPTAAPSSTNQFGVIFADFGTTDASASFNGVVGAVVNYDPANPRRLYVARRNAAVNSANNTENRAQMGVGAIDEWGNAAFRADDFGTTGPNALTGNNIFLVDLIARGCGTLNIIDAAGGSDPATKQIVTGSATVHNTPNIGPKSVFGSAYYLGTNFNTLYLYGATNPPAATGAHLAGLASDHRGGMVYMTRNHPCVGGAAAVGGTGGVLSQSNAGGGLTDSISLWGLSATGAVTGGMILTLPATGGGQIVDHVTGVTSDPVGPDEFDHYHGSTAYRGGNAQVGLNVDRQGRLLAAATVYQDPVFAATPFTYIACARVDESCNTQWGIVAYSTDETFLDRTGKPILDGTGAQIGVMTTMNDVTGGNPTGPSISAPAIDSAGNVWFVSAVALDKVDQFGTPFVDTDSALLRAVYDETLSAGPGWSLELILELGDVFPGANSGTLWQVQFTGIASSAGGINSGTLWSQNVAESGFLGVDPLPMVPTRHPETLGGIVLNAEITYDTDADFDWDDPTSSGGDAASPDQSYSALLYIQAGCLLGDGNGDYVVDLFDIDPFVQALTNQAGWEAAHPDFDYACVNDINGDGIVDLFDIDPFVSLLTAK